MGIRCGVLFLITVIFYLVRTSNTERRHADNVLYRSIKKGDVLTAIEFVPIAKLLIAKVPEPGSGRGIISGETSPENLAEKLFSNFFLSPKRIVVVEESDLPGLDAIQALALGGLGIDKKNLSRILDLTPVRRDAGDAGPLMVQLKCQYKLLKKADEEATKRRALKIAQKLSKKRVLIVQGRQPRRSLNESDQSSRHDTNRRKGHSPTSTKSTNQAHGQKSQSKNSNRAERKRVRRVLKIASKLAKKRQLLVKGRKHLEKNESQKDPGSADVQNHGMGATYMTPTVEGEKKLLSRFQKQDIEHIDTFTPISWIPKNEDPNNQRRCRWKYMCTNVMQLSSCKLRVLCFDKNEKPDDDVFILPNSVIADPDKAEKYKKMRKLLGITVVDEEMEKIIERRVMAVRPDSMLNNPADVSLNQKDGDFFANLNRQQRKGSSSPSPPHFTGDKHGESDPGGYGFTSPITPTRRFK